MEIVENKSEKEKEKKRKKRILHYADVITISIDIMIYTEPRIHLGISYQGFNLSDECNCVKLKEIKIGLLAPMGTWIGLLEVYFNLQKERVK